LQDIIEFTNIGQVIRWTYSTNKFCFYE